MNFSNTKNESIILINNFIFNKSKYTSKYKVIVFIFNYSILLGITFNKDSRGSNSIWYIIVLTINKVDTISKNIYNIIGKDNTKSWRKCFDVIFRKDKVFKMWKET